MSSATIGTPEEIHVKLPNKYRGDAYMKGLEFALYRLLYLDEKAGIEPLETHHASELTTTRVQLSDTGLKHYKQLQQRLQTNKRNTLLIAMQHIENNKTIFIN